ncbi:protein spaetzle 5 isoform X1 [Cydia amplana]|uniref:protein spaetzle 5 isoform X1 n=1 Tax=Cydia amplana TaxID=1869771 RepID=UPI002FE65EBA
MKRLKLQIRAFFLIAWLSRGDGYSCPYGQNCANSFEPAPPGQAPPCAQPGLTYCVHPEPYPEQIIRRLIEAGQYDISTLLSDETRDDFNSNKKVDHGYGYGPNSIPNVDQISIVNEPKNYNTKFHSRFNHEIYSQKTPLQPPSPVDPSPYNINAFQSSNFSKFGYQNPNYWAPSFDYENKINRPNNVYNHNFYNTPFSQYDSADWFRQVASGVTQYNPNEWWKYPSRSEVTVQRSVTFPTRSTRHRRRRNAELVRASEQRQLTGTEALRIALGLASAETSAERPRRQAPGTEELCRVRTDYITPRAALNNKGSWRYVVNMPNNMTQLVRAEICTSSQCSNLCSVPVGYSSRCEQKYIQKRLVALESSGQSLYTDVFWIPSCCQCTIIANNT